MIPPYDAWALRRLLCGHHLNGEVNAVHGSIRRLVDRLASLTADRRAFAWDGYLCGREDAEDIIKTLAAADPTGPAPELAPPIRPATLADIRRVMAATQWQWSGYIPAARIAGIAAFEGVGKTRFAMDLARRQWRGDPWPDGQPATLPARTPTLWVCADGQQDDLVAIAESLGLPDEALFFNTTPDEPYGGTELDSDVDRERLERFINLVRPGLVFVDTLTNATSFDLCRATENKAMMTPLRDISQRTQTTIVPLLHLSKEGQALGRRIKGITRTIIQLDCPDPEQPERLKLWVSKSFAKRPPALGVTMTDAGNEYDFNPPAAPEPNKGGRPPESRDKARQFIVDVLRRENNQKATKLCHEFEETGGSSNAFWRARDAMVEAGEVTCDGRPLILRLVRLGNPETPEPLAF
jgi:hypothetical protein